MNNIKYIPHKIVSGDTVALVNPAGPLPECFRNQEYYVIDYLRHLGLNVKNNIINENWQSPENRCHALIDAFCDDAVKAVFPICGGPAIYDILAKLDFDKINKHPKIICGYSYISSLLTAISENSHIVTFHAPHLNFLNDRSSKREVQYNIVNFWRILSTIYTSFEGMSNYERAMTIDKGSISPEIPNIYAKTEKLKKQRQDNHYISLSSNDFVCGNISVISLPSLVLLQKIGLMQNLKGRLLFLDTIDTTLENVEHYLDLINKTSPLSEASAIIFSSICDRSNPIPDTKKKIEIFKFLNQIKQKYDIDNLFYGFPLGHCTYKLTIPIGINATLFSKNGSIRLTQSPFMEQTNSLSSTYFSDGR